ncbi:hypothetical protein [Aureimonas psammosilenae]|uniref:hypothetical protein n=1 Tax=Aureimonas psammosilenae TaxID=2495496 RepID=UPI00126094EB|nr:hypothetical protein [Aureimonas psammosilenae]
MTAAGDSADDAGLIDPDETALEIARERRLNAWRRAGTDRARAVVNEVVKRLEEHEAAKAIRARARKAADRERMAEVVDAIVSDLAHLHLGGLDARRRISRSNRKLSGKTRYRPKAFGQAVPAILDALASPELRIIDQAIGSDGGFDKLQARETTISMAPALRELVDAAALGPADFIELDVAETIILRSVPIGDGPFRVVNEIDYPEDAETGRMREQMHQINGWLAAADLAFDDPEDLHGEHPTPDIQDRRLRRIFTRASFESGGRLYGGWWQNMRAARRLRGITINGEQVVELDYGQVGPRLVYGIAGAPLPDHDLYAVPGYEDHRDGIKQMMNAMLCKEGPIVRFPKEVKRLFARNTRAGTVVAAIGDHHVALKAFFGTGLGHELQFRESEIVADLLINLQADGIVALPIHDALMVAASDADRVEHEMREAFYRRSGVQARVSRKGDTQERMTSLCDDGLVPTTPTHQPELSLQ